MKTHETCRSVTSKDWRLDSTHGLTWLRVFSIWEDSLSQMCFLIVRITVLTLFYEPDSSVSVQEKLLSLGQFLNHSVSVTCWFFTWLLFLRKTPKTGGPLCWFLSAYSSSTSPAWLDLFRRSSRSPCKTQAFPPPARYQLKGGFESLASSYWKKFIR